jgi:hypothetical protein
MAEIDRCRLGIHAQFGAAASVLPAFRRTGDFSSILDRSVRGNVACTGLITDNQEHLSHSRLKFASRIRSQALTACLCGEGM